MPMYVVMLVTVASGRMVLTRLAMVRLLVVGWSLRDLYDFVVGYCEWLSLYSLLGV